MEYLLNSNLNKLHVQTEYIEKSRKIICNIFKEGRVLKKIEKKIGHYNPKELEKEISNLHFYVLNKIKEGYSNSTKEEYLNNFQTPDNLFNLDLMIEFERIFVKTHINLENFLKKVSGIESFLTIWKVNNELIEFYISKEKDIEHVKNDFRKIWNNTKKYLKKHQFNLNNIELMFNKKFFYITQLQIKKQSLCIIFQINKKTNYILFKQKLKKLLSDLVSQNF